MTPVQRAAEVPTTIGVEMIGIPEGSELDLDLMLTFVDEGILVTGAVGLVSGAHPDWDYRTVIRAILETARPSPHLVGRCRTGGMLDVEAAIDWRP